MYSKSYIKKIGLDAFIEKEINIREYENFKKKFKRNQIMYLLSIYIVCSSLIIVALINFYLMTDLQPNIFVKVPDIKYMGDIYIKYSSEVQEASPQQIRDYYKIQMEGVHLPMEKEDEEIKEAFIAEYYQKMLQAMAMIIFFAVILVVYFLRFIYTMLLDEYSLLMKAIEKNTRHLFKVSDFNTIKIESENNTVEVSEPDGKDEEEKYEEDSQV